ncbi:MAG TPA: hypothetical protein VGS80_26715 [Ktedonobacterales bacterium]|nr:hypothetical protein [Ktedonobacterales bacterium]
MALLVVIWLALGALAGALANAARLRPAAWGRRGWPAMIGLGMGAALLGGWLGVALLGAFYGTGAALWVAVVGVVAGPMLVERVRARTMQTNRTKSTMPD